MPIVPPVSFPTAAIPGIGAVTPTVAPSSAPSATGALSGGFGEVLAAQADRLNEVHNNADSLAIQAATGDLRDVHDYTIAANEASLATQTVVALRNKVVEAFNEVMRMPV